MRTAPRMAVGAVGDRMRSTAPPAPPAPIERFGRVYRAQSPVRPFSDCAPLRPTAPGMGGAQSTTSASTGENWPPAPLTARTTKPRPTVDNSARDLNSPAPRKRVCLTGENDEL
jgi:hypothetical protein